MSKSKGQRFYLCGVAYDHELGNTDVVFYRTKAALRRSFTNGHRHLRQCGIVEVEVRVVRRVNPRAKASRTTR